MTKNLVVLGFLALVMSASAADAQKRVSRPMEFGIDGGISFGMDDPSVTTVSLPVQALRVGFFMNDKVSVEPRFNFNSVSGGGVSLRTYSLELGALYHFGGYTKGSGLYARPFAGIAGVGGDLGSGSDGFMGAGVGVKLPFANRRLATRLEANYGHAFSDGGGSDGLGVLFGLSLFHTR
jgi:hypothetical protein